MKLAGALASSALFHAVSMVSGLATVPLFLRAFGRENFGFWAALLSTTAYLSLLNFGVAQTVSSGASRASPDEPEAVPRLIRFGFRFYLRIVAVALPVAIVIALLCPWAGWFGLGPGHDGEYRLAAAAVFGSFIIELPFSVLRAALYGAGEVSRERMLGVTGLVLRVAAAGVFAVLHPPLWAGVLALSGTNLGVAFLTFLVLRRRFPGLWATVVDRRQSPEPSDAAGLRPQSIHYFVLQIAGAIVWSTDALVTGFVLGAGAAAEVSATWRVVSLVLQLGGVVVPAVAPMLARTWAEGDLARSTALALDTAQVVFALLCVGMLAAGATGQALFTLWLGPGMFPGQGAWLLYTAIIGVQALLVVPEAFVTQTGRHAAFARGTLVEAAVKLLLGILLMRVFGLMGLPMGTILGRCSTTLWILLRSFGQATQQHPGLWVLRVVRPSIVPSAGFVGVFALGYAVVDTPGPMAVFALGTVSAVVYLILYALTGLPEAVRSRLSTGRS